MTKPERDELVKKLYTEEQRNIMHHMSVAFMDEPNHVVLDADRVKAMKIFGATLDAFEFSLIEQALLFAELFEEAMYRYFLEMEEWKKRQN